MPSPIERVTAIYTNTRDFYLSLYSKQNYAKTVPEPRPLLDALTSVYYRIPPVVLDAIKLKALALFHSHQQELKPSFWELR
jgi:hypothetical protein